MTISNGQGNALEGSTPPSNSTAPGSLSPQERYDMSMSAASVLRSHGLIDGAGFIDLSDRALTAYADELG